MADTTPNLSPLFTWRSALAESDLSSSARLVAHVLGTYMNERGGSCFPGQGTIASDAGVAKNTVIRALDELESKGWLAIKRGGSRKGKKRVPNTYTAVIPNTLDQVSSETGAVSEPVQPVSETGAVSEPEPVQPARCISPLNTPDNTPSSLSHLRPDLLVRIVGKVVECEVERRKGTSNPVRSRRVYTDECLTNAERDHGDLLDAWIAHDPHADPDDVAEAVASGEKPPCGNCNDFVLIETDDGFMQCPTCCGVTT